MQCDTICIGIVSESSSDVANKFYQENTRYQYSTVSSLPSCPQPSYPWLCEHWHAQRGRLSPAGRATCSQQHKAAIAATDMEISKAIFLSFEHECIQGARQYMLKHGRQLDECLNAEMLLHTWSLSFQRKLSSHQSTVLQQGRSP
jgi:hypothetical protein